jgi:HD-GYP domain-containing protein (c-di-GMP phosphodiesterase class II)
MRTRFTFRFQHWVIAVNVLLVVLLTGAFLALVFGKFQEMAETNAEQNFSLQADKAFHQLHQELQSQRSFVELMAMADVGLAGQSRDIDADHLLPLLVRSLQAQPSRYSVYFGLPNGDFVQVVGVRGDARIQAALKAPDGTTEAVRTIRLRPGGDRVEAWQFRTADGGLLAERQAPAQYDPTTRPWYQGAVARQNTFLTAPYRFASNGALGVTFAAPLRDGRGVFGVDVSLQAFNAVVNSLTLSPHGAMVVLDPQRNILAIKADAAFHGGAVDVAAETVPLNRHPGPLLAQLGGMGAQEMSALRGRVDLAGRPFVLATRTLEPLPGTAYQILALAPLSDFTAVVERSRRDVLVLAAVMVLVIIPAALFSTRRVATALVALAQHSDRLRRLDFSTRPARVTSFLSEVNALGHVQQVMHDSLAQRTLALEAARFKLAHLVQIGIRLGKERNSEALLEDVLRGAQAIAHCAVARLHVHTGNNTLRMALCTNPHEEVADIVLPKGRTTTSAPEGHLVLQAALGPRTVVVGDLHSMPGFTPAMHEALQRELHTPVVSALAVPLVSSAGEVLGVLQLFNTADAPDGPGFDPEVVEFMEALCAQAAVAMDNQTLLQSQRELMDAMIQMLASAIDAKSAYTAGHCARVPELALMLAEEATQVQEGPLAEFGFTTEDEWREFRIGAWLHDCGKVTTPEYVVDKATKLETIYNRIHEVRMRFEVLLRDAEILALRNIAAGEPQDAAWAACHARAQQLQEDFAFIAEANLGGEFMAPADVQRLHTVGAQTWLRHFDNRLGLAQDEARRHAATPAAALPVAEPLLADQPYHLFAREGGSVALQGHGFEMKVPQHLYHHGELHNLSIGRGTLNEEERFKINEHIMHTIVMLERMPFPKQLQRVAEYAGTHHETVSGTGYPRKLGAEQLSVPARIMAIADIFEALTASDRPYKKAKPLSEAIRILHRFKQDGHIDPELFDLFLRSGIHQRYAERFLQPEQRDVVDIGAYLGPVTPRAAVQA